MERLELCWAAVLTVQLIFAKPWGVWLTGILGAVAIAFGPGQFGDASKATFRKDLHHRKMNRAERIVVDGGFRAG